jgi:hypothetical protein
MVAPDASPLGAKARKRETRIEPRAAVAISVQVRLPPATECVRAVAIELYEHTASKIIAPDATAWLVVAACDVTLPALPTGVNSDALSTVIDTKIPLRASLV